ncbi:sensor histidine kinase [Flagellimonas pacifica]|uniref:Histidine kinase n=1 Tax=Flagellimonas pacifica TaxID=1247520 RepID=A0A285MS95_9FLAO|nr:histidine kinase [Allomuricauda parva]SNY99988.1 Histidine kinase [Allomuricauda parva]
MGRNLFLIVLGFTVGALFYSFHNFSGKPSFWELILNGVLGVLVSYAFHFCNLFLNKTVRWKQQTGFRLLLGIVCHMLIGFGIVFLGLRGYELLYPEHTFFSISGNNTSLKIGILLVCTILIYNIIYFVFYSYRQYTVGQIKEVQYKRKQTELQLNALKSQLSPHFLFNSLNTLSSLFRKDVKKAEEFIRSLAKSYQYTLKTYSEVLVTLEDELDFVHSYCFMVQTRFGNHFSLDLQLSDEELKNKIPPLTLQMLVENAVKHNVLDAKNPLKVYIKTYNGFLEVSNNKTKSPSGVKSLKIGLKNIVSRYELLANKQVKIINGEDFTVQLPIIK